MSFCIGGSFEMKGLKWLMTVPSLKYSSRGTSKDELMECLQIFLGARLEIFSTGRFSAQDLWVREAREGWVEVCCDVDIDLPRLQTRFFGVEFVNSATYDS